VNVELVRVLTRDGVRLDGAYERVREPRARIGDVLCLHGAAGNFYSGAMFERLVEPLRDRGWGVLRVNTRGHDGYFPTRTAAGPARLGAAYERVGDCEQDVTAWLDWLAGRGAPRAVVLGHSLGAIKALHSQVHARHALARGIIAISPPRLSAGLFRSNAPERFLPTLEEAERRIAEGQPRAILESPFPFPMLITAESFRDKYGAEAYHIVDQVRSLAIPAGFIYGARELVDANAAFAELPEILADHVSDRRLLRFEIIPDADHFYVGYQESLNAAVLAMIDWIGGPGSAS